MLNWSFLPNFHEKIQVELGLSICHIFFVKRQIMQILHKRYVRCEGKIKSYSTSYIYIYFFFSKKLFKNPSLRKHFQYFVCVLNNGVNESFKKQQFFFRIFQLGHPIHSECELNSTHQNRTIYMKKSHGKHKWNYFLKYLLRRSIFYYVQILA